MILATIYWISFIVLLLTKAADVASTSRFPAPEVETNPWARRVFQRFGLKRGLLIVSAVFLLIAGGQYTLVWWLCSPLVQALNAVLGFLIAWIQWDVARFNRTGEHSRITSLAFRFHQRWTAAAAQIFFCK